MSEYEKWLKNVCQGLIAGCILGLALFYPVTLAYCFVIAALVVIAAHIMVFLLVWLAHEDMTFKDVWKEIV